jgi:uncharacterized protein
LKRIVIDANTLASGSTDPHRDSPPSLLYSELKEMRFETIACPELISEVADTLHKPYFRARADEEAITEITTGIAETATMLPDPIDPEPVLRDPKDDYLLALARTAKADFIVTGDKDLLEHIDLQPPAINARNACELLGLIEPS